MSGDMEQKRHAYIVLVLSLSLLPSFQVAYSRSNVYSGSDDEFLPREERERDFMEWVSLVGSRNHSTPFGAADLISSKIVGSVLTVDQSGKGNFRTVQAAVNAVLKGYNQRVVIRISAGVYRENVEVPAHKPYITFQGAGRDVTKITWDDTASSAGSTTHSATVGVNADYFIARDISFENSAPPPPSGSTDKQAVAFRISGDKAAFYNCNFLGQQDTLFDAHGRHYFESCFIQGSVDFICGDGQSLYMGCELHSIPRSYGSLTAQKRSKPSENTGFSFVNCKVTGSGMVFLGRAWGPYSRVVFSHTYIDNIIVPKGWYNWGDPMRERTVFYGEYQCTGPGANNKGRVGWSHQLTADQAAPFQTLSFVDGETWLQT